VFSIISESYGSHEYKRWTTKEVEKRREKGKWEKGIEGMNMIKVCYMHVLKHHNAIV
jgi:hypothetical protein